MKWILLSVLQIRHREVKQLTERNTAIKPQLTNSHLSEFKADVLNFCYYGINFLQKVYLYYPLIANVIRLALRHCFIIACVLYAGICNQRDKQSI